MPKLRSIKQPTLSHYKPDLSDVTDILKWVCIKHYQVCAKPRFNRSNFSVDFHHSRGGYRCRLNCFEWSQASFHLKLQLAMKRMPGHADIRASNDWYSRLMQRSNKLQPNVQNHTQCFSRRFASGERTSTLSPQSVLPFHGAFPVATTMLPVAGSTVGAERPQIAESLESQLELEARTLAGVTGTEDGWHGITSMLSGSRPVFHGR